MKRILNFILLAALLIGIGFVFFTQYEFIFAKVVTGRIIKISRIMDPTTIIGQVQAAQLYSFAIAIRNDSDNLIYTSSTEDRQWAAASENFCVKAKFYPYPPWDLAKSDTYHNARLLQLMDCPTKDATALPKPNDPANANSQAAPSGNPAAVSSPMSTTHSPENHAEPEAKDATPAPQPNSKKNN